MKQCKLDKNKPLITVIIPTYNYGHFLPEAIESVFNQTYKNIELIIVDDGSTDNTRELITKNYIHKLKYIYQENRGPASARNTGIKESTGEFIAFLDADDIWLPEKLEFQLRKILKKNIGLVYSGIYIKDDNNNITEMIIPPKIKSQKDLLKKLFIKNVILGSDSAVLIKKECFHKVGLFDESLRGAEDRDMWLRIGKYFKFDKIDRPLVIIRKHQKNISKNLKIMKKHQIRVVHKNYKLYKDLLSREELFLLKRKALSYIYLDQARRYYFYNKQRQCLYNLVKSIMYYPAKSYERDDKYILLIKSILGPHFIAKLKSIVK